MEAPVFPLIVISPHSSVKICNNSVDMSRIRLSEWIYQSSSQFAYDSAGTRWTFQFGACPVKRNIWNEIRNPEITVAIQWTDASGYEVQDLKLELSKLLEMDDEVLTEHVNQDYMRRMIGPCASFTELLSILNKYVFAVNEEELWREMEENNVF